MGCFFLFLFLLYFLTWQLNIANKEIYEWYTIHVKVNDVNYKIVPCSPIIINHFTILREAVARKMSGVCCIW